MTPQQALVREPPVHPHRTLRLGAEAVVGEQDDVGVRTCGVDQPPDRLVELVVDREQGGAHVVVEPAGRGMLGIDVLPEVVLHAVGRVEHDADAVARPRRHHARRRVRAQPRLPPHALEIRECPLVVVRIAAPQVLRRGQVDLVLSELARDLGRLRERRPGRRQHAAHQVAVRDRPQRI